MIKRILKIWFTIAMYELGKWLGRELYYKLSANDEVDKAPNDYANESDQYDINGVRRWQVGLYLYLSFTSFGL